jgi:hypothetical protein
MTVVLSSVRPLSLPLRATRTGGENSFPTFNIMRTWIERHAGIKMTRGGFFHIVGSVEGVYDFDVHRTVKNYARLMVPLEHRDKVRFGSIYTVHLKLVEEVHLNDRQREILAKSPSLQYRPLMYRLEHAKNFGDPSRGDPPKESSVRQEVNSNRPKTERHDGLAARFRPVVRLHSGRNPRLYFRIDMSSFKQKTGIEIEEGGFYRMGLSIEGVWNFKRILRSMAARQDIAVYVPPRLEATVEVGKKCNVVVDWIEKLPRPNDWRTTGEIDVSSWSWKEIASWTDTEGAIGTYLSIGQKDQRVIREICAFFDREGIPPSMRLDEHTGVYYAVVSRIEDVARVVKNIEPFIRTANKAMEIDGFKAYLVKPRKRLNISIIRARKILGVGEH